MLLRIDQLLRNKQALKALIILRQFRLEAEEKIRTKESFKKESYEEFKQKHQHGIAEAVGHKIKILLENNQKQKFFSEQRCDIEGSVHLINFLNTIEDVCYLCHKNYISSEDIEELFEHELSYYFKIFKPYIENLRKYGDSTMYNELQNLSEKIKCKNVCK